jgi:hypothetical protein
MSKTSSPRRRPSASRLKLVRTKPVQKKPVRNNPVPEDPVPQTPRQRELTTKRRGELAELAFVLKAANLGFGVARPYANSERYDFIVDSRLVIQKSDALKQCHPERSKPVREAKRLAESKNLAQPSLAGGSNRSSNDAVAALHHVQVKCSTQLLNGLYRVNAHRRPHGRAVPYLPGEIHFFAAYIIPEDTWYILPLHGIRGATSLLFRRRRDRRPGRYDAYREAWHLLSAE